jgi:hypothetical protein
MSKQSSKKSESTEQVERKAIATKESTDVSRLSSFVDSISDSKNAASAIEKCKSEQEVYVIALASVRDKLIERFTFTQFASAVNASAQCKRLNISAYLYKERKLASVIAQRSNTHSICADRVLHRERVAQIHKQAKTDNSYSTVRVSNALLDRAKHDSDNRARAREVQHSLNSAALSLLDSIVKIVSK